MSSSTTVRGQDGGHLPFVFMQQELVRCEAGICCSFSALATANVMRSTLRPISFERLLKRDD